MEAAGKRGVKIRFLLEEKGIKLSEASTLERLRAIPNLTFRVLPYARVSGGIIHAKYLVVDGKQAYRYDAHGRRAMSWTAADGGLELLEIPQLRSRVTGQLSAGEATRVQLCRSVEVAWPIR